ncbi:MAG TPA: hypothetical protein VLM91_06745, partial [Candidatus Methylomirabilis sp.]|nr:hypothetical protein [Candidatus Methylomirabilis sp.]
MEVVNLDSKAAAVRLLAYDAVGNFLGEIPGGMTLAPGNRGSYATPAGVFPPGTSLLSVESDSPIASVVLLETTDGSAQEILLPGSSPALDLILPVLSGSLPWGSQLRVVNAGTAATAPTVVARDAAGQILGSAPLPALATWASVTVDPGTLFVPAVLGGAATLQVTADQPLIAIQLIGATDRQDVAAIPAPLGQGTQLLVPIVTQGPNDAVWTLAGVVNPQDVPVSVTAEALDAQGNSVGRLGELTSLPARGSHVFRTSDLGGTLPLGTAALLLTAELPLSGYALVGGVTTSGVTALGALGPVDAPAGYDLFAPPDGHTLSAVPWWIGTTGESLSALGEPGTGIWIQRLSTLATTPTSSSSTAPMAAAAAETGQLTLTWTDTANDFDGFKIERKTGSGGTYALLIQLGPV